MAMIMARGIRPTGIRMSDTRALMALAAFFSPSFPTGGFAYSAGLETAVAQEAVRNAGGLRAWLETSLRHGAMRTDAILFREAMGCAGDAAATNELASLAQALCGSAERLAETTDQGAAFAKAAAPWLGDFLATPPTPTPYPVVAGRACALAKIDVADALALFVQSMVSNQLQAAIRLSLTGQLGAAALLAELGSLIAALATEAEISTLDDLGSAALLADIAMLNHETLSTRLFLT
jgi:urease accessory protein